MEFHDDDQLPEHSFVLKLWLEETGDDDDTVLRGHITHVPSGNRRALKAFEEIVLFIQPYFNLAGRAGMNLYDK